MTPTPVGMRCPECSAQRTRVTPAASIRRGRMSGAPATLVLIAISVIAFLAEMGTGSGGMSSASSSLLIDYGLIGAAVADGEWWRIITSGFLHAGLMHLAFNMVALWFLGEILEPSIGTPRFALIYVTSLIAGSFGALYLSGALDNTVGASGAVFGIFGATFVIARARGLSGLAGQLGLLLGINLLLTFSISGISIGGHIGGLIGGLLCGALIVAAERGRLGASRQLIEYGGMVALAVIFFVGALTVAEPFTGRLGALLPVF